MEPWLTKREVAARLGCSVRTVERRITPSGQVGGMNRYLMSQVDAQVMDGPEELPDNVVPLRPRRREVAA